MLRGGRNAVRGGITGGSDTVVGFSAVTSTGVGSVSTGGLQDTVGSLGGAEVFCDGATLAVVVTSTIGTTVFELRAQELQPEPISLLSATHRKDQQLLCVCVSVSLGSSGNDHHRRKALQ